ncbi:MAG TPA: hypothetical protein VK826_04905 [Bacteroidia bacterium]|nr:hypothetical protein [Bacteroidia bacterium]
MSLLLFIRLDGQTLIPGVGIKGDKIVVNVSTLADVISIKGNADTIYNSGTHTYYGYRNSGVSYGYDYYDLSKIIRSVLVQSPFKGCTPSGVYLGITQWYLLASLLNGGGGSTPTRNEVYRRDSGICYYIPKKQIDAVRWDNRQPIYKITLDCYGRFGPLDLPGYIYDSLSEKPAMAEFEKFILTRRSLQTFRDSFAPHPGRNAKPPYEVRSMRIRERILEFEQTESRMYIYCGLTQYELTIFSLHDTIYYAGMTPKSRMSDTARIFLYDTLMVNRLFQCIVETYNPAADSLRSQMHSLYSFLYSPDGCGESSYKNKMCHSGDALIDQQDTAQLAQWLCSGIPEQQAYALHGLWELHYYGLPLSDRMFSLMEHVAALKIPVYTCRGCVTYQVMHFSDIISPRQLRQARRNN